MSSNERLPFTDIPADLRCHLCSFQVPDRIVHSGARQLSFRNHMAMVHEIYYEKKTPAATSVAGKLAKYERHASNLKTVEHLKPWHCVALARHVVYGQPCSDVAKEMKHSPASVNAVKNSPAGQAFIEKMTQELRDPVKLVKDLMASDVFSKHMDWLQAWEWAVQAKDYEAIHRMAKDIGLQPALEQKQQQGPTKISLHLNMNDLAAPQATTKYQLMEAEIVEEAGDGDA